MGAAPPMNRSAKGGARSSLHYGGEGVLIHPPHQGVCGRHGTEEQCVTSGGLTGSPGGTGVSGPIRGEDTERNLKHAILIRKEVFSRWGKISEPPSTPPNSSTQRAGALHHMPPLCGRIWSPNRSFLGANQAELSGPGSVTPTILQRTGTQRAESSKGSRQNFVSLRPCRGRAGNPRG